MVETRMMSGHLSKDARFRLEVEGPYTAENVGRLIELLTLHREWLREPPEREPGTGWTLSEDTKERLAAIDAATVIAP